MLRVVFRVSAGTQVVEAQTWFDKQRHGLGAEFARSLESAVSRVARNPLSAPAVYQDVRRVLLKRFPYSVFYIVQGEVLLVLSCMHTRRAPADWVDG
jgi:ParE toxin of type II toxin-antitoxin system, parDE